MRHLRAGCDGLRGGVAEAAAGAARGPAPPLWTRYLAEAEPPRPGEIVSRLPEDLGAILERAMEWDPRRRYQSALAMAEDLERYVCGAPGPMRGRWLLREPTIRRLGLLAFRAARDGELP